MLWSLASTDKSFVTALMDCSRTEYKASFKGFNQVDTSGAQNDPKSNLHIAFGCPPSDSSEKPSILNAYFERLRSSADDQTGKFTIPAGLDGWKGANGEVEVKAQASK